MRVQEDLKLKKVQTEAISTLEAIFAQKTGVGAKSRVFSNSHHATDSGQRALLLYVHKEASDAMLMGGRRA